MEYNLTTCSFHLAPSNSCVSDQSPQLCPSLDSISLSWVVSDLTETFVSKRISSLLIWWMKWKGEHLIADILQPLSLGNQNTMLNEHMLKHYVKWTLIFLPFKLHTMCSQHSHSQIKLPWIWPFHSLQFIPHQKSWRMNVRRLYYQHTTYSKLVRSRGMLIIPPNMRN